MDRKVHLPACKCGEHHRNLEPGDEWYVNAPQYNNCFYTYMRHNDRPHGLKEIAELLDLSISAITTIERKAFKKLQRRLRRKGIDKSLMEENN